MAVKVKWGREQFQDVELNLAESPLVFKAQLFALTGVHPDRQKVMLKGATLKNVTVLLMGSKEELPSAPVSKPVFMEDMSETELASALDLPVGLANLGNTCYLNATVQCLKSVPELRQVLRDVSLASDTLPTPAGPGSLTAGLKDLLESMESGGGSITPIVLVQFVRLLHLAFPRFAEKGERGGFMQQDANECWTELVRILQQKLPPLNSSSYSSFIDQYFGGVFDVSFLVFLLDHDPHSYKCKENEEEMETSAKENFLQLSCFIAQDVRYLHSGLKSRVQETITKHSPSLSRDAQYLKTMKISRLPAYLTVQFVRFYFKEKESINAKILKDVKFPLMLDVFDLCSEELQQKLIPMRTKFKDYEDKKVEEDQKVNKGSNNSGYYDLQAVLTHRGRSSSSGHYVAWIRRTRTSRDWHCAYVLLYGPRILETDTPVNNS
ncbi:USP14 [Cordylochernes scorpioides]|uniref:Ubiquitin carboxyl-terminal hydrolase n=1 Tax=Cordylochernes scorpioides TaxID=51811 RepID=A0ABY6KV23_9ARAC|nr:USP14 [Cordylochernes scorpioides]